MADNLDITQGSGTTVATDDVGGVHYQKVKLVNGTADDATAIPGDANGLKVQLGAAIPAGTNGIGKLTANDGVDIGDVTLNNTSVVVEPKAATAFPVTDNGGSLTVDGALTATDTVTSATFVVKTVDFGASETAQTIWDPTGGTKFVITDIVVSASAAGAITLFDNTDNTTLRVCKLNLAQNGGAVINYRKPYISATADNILKYTTGSGIAGSLTVSGYEV